MIRLHLSGVYSFLPLGWRVLRKVAQIIREEMEQIGAQEFLLPTLSRKDIWEKTGRWQQAGDLMFKLKDRRGTDLCLPPTHEEIFTAIAADEIRSYRELPQIWYQIQTKFRDEPRPRSGVLRGRQFLMKDSYSFDTDQEGLERSYQLHRRAYLRIFQRCELETFTVSASSGIMGGSESEEFMISSPAGEDEVVLCRDCGYAANLEVATAGEQQSDSPSPSAQSQAEKVFTPDKKTIEAVSKFLELSPSRLMKSLLFISERGPVMALISGEDQLDESKLKRELKCEFCPATPEEALELTGAHLGFIGPVELKKEVQIIADHSLKDRDGLVTGANQDDFHLKGLKPGRDFRVEKYADLRMVQSGDPCPHCGSPLETSPAIEVGHIFKLGTKYSQALGATYLDPQGEQHPIVMGSYGIGLERIVASVIEQHSDKDGIVWPISIAPYQIHLLPINPAHQETKEVSEQLYQGLLGKGFEVLIDDRELRAGTKFKDADLIGIPLRVTIGEKGLSQGEVEIRFRKSGKIIKVLKTETLPKIQEIVGEMEKEVKTK
jgi:prolyl-tRNA synthetase